MIIEEAQVTEQSGNHRKNACMHQRTGKHGNQKHVPHGTIENKNVKYVFT